MSIRSSVLGSPMGRSAVMLDVLTDALIPVGQHGLYCTACNSKTRPAASTRSSVTRARERMTWFASFWSSLKRRNN